jgi:3-methyl-2-oxobutanoate hydroxymethyltransferase
MADMPFMSYQVNDDEAVRNSGRFMTEGMADCVKLEVDQGHAALVSRMTRAGVPVVAHIGSKPQQAAIRGGYSSAARTPGEIRELVEDAKALENAGAVLLLLEAVPDEATSAVLEATQIPVIGIGAGTQCHGQVLVIHDLLGISETPPRFAAPVASLGRVIEDAGREWVKRVGAREIGGTRYTMRQGS